uniref:ATRX chromatin remodeler n=1 Tax=Hippocampus comes TaxID=109280 RepID=A0A3Q2XK59_HIPCM
MLPQVEEFKYLGVLLTSEGRREREIDRRIEFRGMELQNGDKGQRQVRKSRNAEHPVVKTEDDELDEPAVTHSKSQEGHADQHDVKQHVEPEEEQAEPLCNKLGGAPDEETEKEPHKEPLLSPGETSLDHDIMSVPPSVPEELFQMVESLADPHMLFLIKSPGLHLHSTCFPSISGWNDKY